MITVRNIVLLALAQVGVIMAGVLTGGLARRLIRNVTEDGWRGEVRLPAANLVLVDWWVIWMLVPLIWVTATLVIQHRRALSDEVKTWTFSSGFLVAAALLVFVWFGGFGSLLRAFRYLGG
jgi:hypothetical protein